MNVARRVDVQPLLDKLPTWSNLVLGPGQLEVEDVNDQEESKLRVIVARRPLRTQRFEANTADVVVAVLLPEGADVRMAVQRFPERNDWFS